MSEPTTGPDPTARADPTAGADPTALLDTLAERDLDEHAGVFERVYDALAQRLAGAED